MDLNTPIVALASFGRKGHTMDERRKSTGERMWESFVNAEARAQEQIQYEKRLKELREAEQSRTAEQDKGVAGINKQTESASAITVPGKPDGPETREFRLQSFIAKKKTTIAAVSRAASIHKTNMQQWRRGELSDTSVMSQRIEDVLSGKTSIG